MEDAYDVIVIGGGPAGLAAATETARAGLRTLCLDRLAPGGALINLTSLHGVPEGGDGPTLAARLSDAATEAGVELGFGDVVGLAAAATGWTVETEGGERCAARAVVVATGLGKGRLGLPGEDAFEGRGLSHCAACDGPLYAGQPVVVAGIAGWGWQEALELKGFTDDVTVVDGGPPPDDSLAHVAGRIVGLEGEDGLERVIVEGGAGRRPLPARGLFVYLGQSPAAEFLPESLARDSAGHIVVDEEGRTSLASVFAVGDVRQGARQALPEAIADGRRAGRALVQALAQT